MCVFLCALAVPRVEDVTKRAGKVLDEFKDLVYPADYVPGQKRKVSMVELSTVSSNFAAVELVEEKP